MKETFDKTLESQHTPQSSSTAPDSDEAFGNYKGLLEKIGEGILPLKPLIEKEAHFQAVLHGAFSHYSDIKLGESKENRALVLTEFQTGRGKRIDMVVHGIKFADQASSAKEYDPVGLELKGPRKGTTTDALKDEANEQITDEYTKGVTYKTLTDGKEVNFVGVVFDKSASSADSLILMSKDEFASVKVIHSSIFSFSQQQPGKRFDPNSCVGQSSRSKRSINNCLFSKSDVEKFSKGKVDENNVDKIIIDSEKFLTYIKSSQDEGKNAQLIEFVGDKNIEGNHKYLFDKVVEDQGYGRYIENERIKNLHGDISQQTGSTTKSSKLKSRLMNAAGGIQLIRGIHGAIVSCKDGTATDCGLNLGGIGWSFASQPIENVMVKITPKVVVSAEKVVGKIIPGTLGKQTKFVIRVAGVKFGSTVAKGTAGALTGVFDIVDIGMSASNLVDCKKRENSDNPCGEKEIRDNIASISFSGVSFVSGVTLTAASMPGVGIAVGFGLMVGYGIYSGVSNIVEYEKKYDTTHEENWSIFWRTLLFQGMASDVQHLATRKDAVNSLAKEVWKGLNNGPNSVVAYGVGLGEGNPLRPCSAEIVMSSQDADTRGISRVIPDSIKNAKMICLPRITNADYEKGLKKSVPTAVHYCDNAMVIADGRKSMQSGKTIVYDLRNVNSGNIIGSNVLDNSFLIFEGSEKIIGGDNTVNRFVLTNSGFAGKIIVGTNSTNVFDLSQIADDVVKVNIVHSIGSTISKTLHSGVLEIKMNDRSLINECVTNDVNILGYHYIGRQNKIDEVSCTSSTGDFIDYDTIIDSKGGYNNDKRDIIENCDRAIILPYTNAKGVEGNYTFYVRNAEYTGTNLYSEIDVKGTGTVIFPETDLLNDCDEITYSSNNNTLSLKIGLGQNNRYTLDIKNYIKQSTSKPNFILIDKNGSNIVPKIKELGATKINSFELHSEYALDNFDDVENHYKKILNNNKNYKVFSVIRGKTQSQDNNAVPHMFFGSLEDDIVNFDQGTTFARGGEGNDVYLISSDINSREVKIDNNSDDRKLDAISMPEISEEFRIQECDLYLDYNNTNVQVKNYLKDNRYRHLTVMNSKGEAFIPYMQSASCVGSSEENGKLVPFFHATQTQSTFLLSKNFQGDRIVIDSRFEDIEKYKDKDDLLLIRESEIPFIIRIEGFYTDRSKWENISYSLWNNNDLFPSPGLLGNIDNVMECKDKLRDDYKMVVKEYIIDFSNSIGIEHNQKLERNILTFVGQDEERMGVMILKNITPDQVEVSSNSTDLILHDKRSNRTVNIKNWNNSKSYRISTLEFDLGLEPIKIHRLDRFSLSEVGKIQDLIGKASENYQNRDKYTPKTENDFKCLISIDSFESKNRNPTYQCLGFSSLQDQINFTENVCSVEQIEDFRGKISNNDQVLLLLKKLQNDLSLNDYDQNIIDQCNKLMITSELEILKLLINNAAQKGEWERVKDLLDTTANRSNADIENKKGRSSTWTLLHYAVYNGNLDLLKDTYQLLLSKVIDVNAKDKYGCTPLYYAIYYNEPEMVEFFIDKGANIDIKSDNGKIPVEVANEYGKPKIMSILINKVIENGQFDVVKNFLKKTAKKTSMKDENEWRVRWKLLHYAAYNGELNIVKDLFGLLLEKSGDVNVEEDYYSYTPLHCAVYYNRHEMVKFLIEQGANIEARTVYSDTPLHIAARYCGLDMAVLLVRRGCNIKAKNNQRQVPLEVTQNQEVRRFLKSPLHYAAREGDMDLLQAVLKVDDNYTPLRFNVTDPESGTVSSALIPYDTDNQTPLHYAVQYNRFDLIKVFTLGGSEYITFVIGRLSLIGLINAKDGDGRTPLHIAAQQGCMASITLLLDGGATIEVVDSSSRTPLHIAAYYHKFDAVKYLISRGANTNAKDKVGKSPHYYLISEYRAYDKKRRSTSDSVQQSCTIQSQAERLDVFELLIGKANIEDRDGDGQTPFHVAAQKGKLGVARLLVNKIESINFEDSLHEEPDELVRAVRQRERLKFLINQKDKFDYTPLQYAAKNGKWDVVNLFLDKTAERNQDDVAGKDKFSTSWTTVHYAVYNGNMSLFNDIFQFLSDKETIINTKDSSDWTPLHYAVYYNALGVVKFLVNKGADINAKDKDGITPLDLAVQGNETSVEEFLKQTQLDLDKQLLAAVQDCNLSKAEVLVSRGANINTKNDDGYTSLHLAVLKNFRSGIDYLIKEGANIDDKDNIGRAPLHWASRDGYLDIVQAIAEGGANLDVKDKDNKTPSDLASWKGYDNIVQYLKQVQLDKKLSAAVKDNDCHEVKNLVSQGASLEAKDRNGRTSLYWASCNGHLDAVECLVGKGANINTKDRNGKMPLDIARDKGHDNVVEYLQQTQLSLDKQLFTAVQDGDLNKVQDLVSRGVNLDAIGVHDTTDDNNHGWTPILYAAKGSKWDIVKFLIVRGAKFNNEITYQGTPLHFAVQKNDLGMVQILLNKGAKVESEDSYNRKPLHLAAEVSGLNIMKLLLGNGANVDAIDMYRQTPLYFAIDKDKSDVVKLLLDSGANFDVVDVNGQTPLYLAKQEKHAGIVKILEQAKLNQELLTVTKIGDLSKVKDSLKQGADINAEDKDGNTSLHNAASKGYLNVVQYLIEKGASLEAKDHDSRTPIYDASWNGHLDIVKCLIEKGVNVNATDKNGWTPLHWAASKGNLEIAKSLIEKGADINAKNIYGKKPIHRAAEKNYETVIELLLSKGANVNDTDKSGWTPLHWASKNGHLDVVKYLIGKGADINAKDKGGKTPLDIAKDKGHNNIVEYLEKNLKEERGEPLQRKRRHHHGDHARHHMSRKPLAINQPEIAASSGTRPSSWINDLFGWVKSSIGGLLGSRTALPEKTFTQSSISQISAPVDVNGTIMLLDLLIRKVTGQKYISTVDQSISPLEAKGYALSITKGFEKVVEQAALKSGISMHRLNIDYMGMQKEITKKVMSGKFNEISGVLKSYVEKACPGEEAGKLSSKKFDKFIAQFNKGLLNQSIEQILHNRDGTLEVDGAKQMSLEPQSYLSNASVHSHSEVSTCLSDVGVTKLGGNLNR